MITETTENIPQAETEKTDLKKLHPEELEKYCEQAGLKGYRADQIFQWLYQKGVSGFDEMTNLSKDLRSRLGAEARVSRLKIHSQQKSSDGTIKFLFELDDESGDKIEAVLIPDFYPDGVPNRLTVCVSSQVGCVFGCSFCATGKMGFYRNLTHGEIVDQIQIINGIAEEEYGKGITNIVYMGMGEPLHNYRAVVTSAEIISNPLGLELSPRRITISTVGLPKQIRKLADENRPFNLAISLHAADDEKRNEIMPINKSMDLSELRDALVHYYRRTQKGVTYEYILFDEFNDHPEDARKLAAITQWIPSKVNIIMYNRVEGVQLKRAREERLDRFMRVLVSKEVTATVRRSRGDDIDAGCGQLAIREDGRRGKTIAE